MKARMKMRLSTTCIIIVKAKMARRCVHSKRKSFKKIKIFALAAVYLHTLYKQKCVQRRYWVRPFLQKRKLRGEFHVGIPDMINDDPEYYFEHFRMTPETFEVLLSLVGPKLKKQNVVRESISPAERLQMTLAYLVSGDQQKSVAKNYRVGRSTVCQIIQETCQAIFQELQNVYLKPPTTEEFQIISKEFESAWNFPHCVGAVDGKHFAIPAPPNSGSRFYNYKGYFSVVLLAVCDANYNFVLTNCGASGSESDGGIFRRSEIGKRVFQQTLNLPEPDYINGIGTKMPYCFVGDEAFPLLKNMMRPYPGDKLEISKRVFNYRLSRARRIIENTFGIFVARWQLLKDTINLLPCNAVHAINACLVLHNFLKSNQNTKRLYIPTGFVDREDHCTGEIIPGLWRSMVNSSQDLSRQGSNNYQKEAACIRDEFKRFFNDQGAVAWQMDSIIDY